MNRQQHPDSAKRQAEQLYRRHGARRAAQVTGIPLRTIRHWARTGGWQPIAATGQRPDQRVAGVAPLAGTQPAAPKRADPAVAELRRALLSEARACLARLGQDREAGRSGAARNWAWCVGVLIDKAVLKLPGTAGDAGQDLDPAAVLAGIDQLLDVVEGRTGG